MQCSVELNQIEVGSTVIQAPYTADYYEVVDGVAVVVLNSFFTRKKDDRDFDLDSDSQNVQGFDESGNILWTVSDMSHEGIEKEKHYYKKLFRIDDDLLVNHTNERLYELDATTGDIVGSWPKNYLPLGESTIELDGEISQIIDAGDRVFVSVAGTDIALYRFDKDGAELWSAETRRGNVYFVDGNLYEEEPHGPRRTTWHLVDQETGERVKTVEYPL